MLFQVTNLMLRVLRSMDGRPLGTYSGAEKLFEVGKADVAAGVDAQVQAMKIGAQVWARLCL